jgi:hypothetical protein
MTTSTRAPYPSDVMVRVDSIICDTCYPEVTTIRLPGPVFEITCTHSADCGLPTEVIYA